MADTVNLPGFGKVKKTYAITGGLVLVLVAGIAWYRSQGEPDAAPIEQDSSVINPATGFPYGSAEDAYALAGQGFSYSSGIIGDTGSAGGGGGGGGAPTSGAFVTNGQWSQAAEDYLVETIRLEPNTVGNALGKYITGGALNPDQVTIIEQSIAFTGYPPVNGPTGYPPSYRTSAETPPATPPAAPPKTLAAPKIVKVTPFREHVDIDWNPVTGATGYKIFINGAYKTSATYTSEHIWHLRPNTTYRIGVQAVIVDPTGPGSADIAGPTSTVTVKTKR